MKKEELEKELEEIDKMIFNLEMKDTWTQKDFERSEELKEKADKINKELIKWKNI